MNAVPLTRSIEALRTSYQEATKVPIACPLCGGTESNHCTNVDRHDLGLNVVTCRRCSLAMISPRPETQWFDYFYQQNYWPVYISSCFKDLDEMFTADRCAERAEQIFHAIDDNFPQAPQNYLDVGCGQGAMIAEFRKRYPTAQCIGVEPSADAADFCRRRHEVTVEALQWDSLDSDTLPGPFDVITLIHVLEHVVDPVDVLTKAVDRLSSNGRIYVEVPDLLSDRWSGKDFFHIAHVWYFHELALRNLFLRCGLDVTAITRGAAEVWPWAIGFVGKANMKGPQPADAVPTVPMNFIHRLQGHLARRDVPVAGVIPRLQRQLRKPQKKNLSAINASGKKPVPDWIKVPVHGLLRKYTSVRMDEISALEKRLRETENLLEFVAADETHRWLYQNRLERMDATLTIFDERRRQFHLDRYRYACRQVAGKRVLDCATGTGYGVRLLRELGGAVQAFGVDIERKAIDYARKNHQVEGTQFLCASADCLPLPDSCFDVVVSFETIEHVPDDHAVIAEFHRVLRPAGRLIVSTPNQWPLADAPFHVREYDRRSFEAVLAPGFECLEIYNQNSGSEAPFNRGQPRAMVATSPANEQLAECFIAVCRRK